MMMGFTSHTDMLRRRLKKKPKDSRKHQQIDSSRILSSTTHGVFNALDINRQAEQWEKQMQELSLSPITDPRISQMDESLLSQSREEECSEKTWKKTLISRSSSRDEAWMMSKMHRHNCFYSIKNLVLGPQTRARLHNIVPVSFNICSSKVLPRLQRDANIVELSSPTSALEDGALVETKTTSPFVQSWRCFSHEEIRSATANFNQGNLIGKGGYADVYKGVLSDGQCIAVKRLVQGSEDQRERQFLVEIGIMGHVLHPNTISLIGFCVEGGLYLIFHYFPHGSLSNYLHGGKHEPLEWPIRYKVAIGIARGLHYLHKSCKRRIIHRDIKASNILLGPAFEPQISDFGLAKWLPKQWTHHSILPVEGTFGYLAPEYFMHGIADERTDVYSFGVLLLEIISGRKAVDNGSQQSLVLWARPFFDTMDIQKLVDPELVGGAYDFHQMKCMVQAASLCVRQSALARPSMSEVLELLTNRCNSDYL